MSLLPELEELQNKRAKLEDESLSLKEKQQSLEEKAKGLEQKIIQELSSKNEKTQQTISSLESKINDLEQRLGQIKQEHRTLEQPNEIFSGTSNTESTDGLSIEINKEAIEKSEENETVVVTDMDDSSVHAESDEEQDFETHTAKESKKRRFF